MGGDKKAVDAPPKDVDNVKATEAGPKGADLLGEPEGRRGKALVPAPDEKGLMGRLAAAATVDTGIGGETKASAVKAERSLKDAQQEKAARTDAVKIAGQDAEVDRNAKGEIIRVRTGKGEITTERLGENKWVSTVKGQLVQYAAEGTFVEGGDGQLQFKSTKPGAVTDAQEVRAVLESVGKEQVVESKLGGMDAHVKTSVVGLTATGDVVHNVKEVALADGRVLERRPGQNVWSANFASGEELRFQGNVVLKDSGLKVVTLFPKHDVEVGIKATFTDANGKKMELTVDRAGVKDFLTKPANVTEPSIEMEALRPIKDLVELDSNQRPQAIDSYKTLEGRQRILYSLELTAEQGAALIETIKDKPGFTIEAEGTAQVTRGRVERQATNPGAYEYDGLKYDLTSTQIKIVKPDPSHGIYEPSVAVMERGKEPYKGFKAYIGGFIDQGEDWRAGDEREEKEESGKKSKEPGRLSSVSNVMSDPRSNFTADHIKVTEMTVEEAMELRAGDDARGIKEGDRIARPFSTHDKSYGFIPVREVLENNRLLAFDYGRQLQQDAVYGLTAHEQETMRSVNNDKRNPNLEIVGFRSQTADGKEQRIPVIASKLDADGKPLIGSMEELAKAYSESPLREAFGIKDAVLLHKEGEGFTKVPVKEGQNPVKAVEAARLDTRLRETRVQLSENVYSTRASQEGDIAKDFETREHVRTREMPDGTLQMVPRGGAEDRFIAEVAEAAKTRDVTFRIGDVNEIQVKAGTSVEELNRAVGEYYDKTREIFLQSEYGQEKLAEWQRHLVENDSQAKMDRLLSELPRAIIEARSEAGYLPRLVSILGEMTRLDSDGYSFNQIKGFDEAGKARVGQLLLESGFKPIDMSYPEAMGHSLETQARVIIGNIADTLSQGRNYGGGGIVADYFNQSTNEMRNLYARQGSRPSDLALLAQLSGETSLEASKFAMSRIPALDAQQIASWEPEAMSRAIPELRENIAYLAKRAKGDPVKEAAVAEASKILEKMERDLRSSDEKARMAALDSFDRLWSAAIKLQHREENAQWAAARERKERFDKRVAAVSTGMSVATGVALLGLLVAEGMSEKERRDFMTWARSKISRD